MDDRKKKIIELERRINDNQASLNTLCEGLGKALLSRPDIGAADGKILIDPELGKDLDEYRRLQKEIEDAEASIKEAEIQIARMRELEEDIQAKDQEENAQAKELAGYYTALGRQVLEDSALDDFSAQYRTQSDALVPKIKSLEDRLAGLTDQGEAGNVFTWIGKSAQSMVLRSFLTKSMDNLERLYRTVGEQFYRFKAENYRKDSVSNAEIINLGDKIEKSKSESAALAEELKKLREEQREIDNQFSASGGPLKQIQGLRKKIGDAQESLKALYLHFGEAVSLGAPAGETSGGGKKRSKDDAQLIGESEQKTLDDIERFRRLIQEDGAAIEKLQASLEIDDEWERIDKYRRSIADKKAKIAEAEQGIIEYESRIQAAEKHIEELRQVL